MTEEVEVVLTSEVRMAIGQCTPGQLFTLEEIKRWAKTVRPGAVFSEWVLEDWAEDHGFKADLEGVTTGDVITLCNNSTWELLNFVKDLDRDYGRWKLTESIRDWANEEMAKHELVKNES